MEKATYSLVYSSIVLGIGLALGTMLPPASMSREEKPKVKVSGLNNLQILRVKAQR